LYFFSFCPENYLTKDIENKHLLDPTFLGSQDFITSKMRGILVNWIFQVAEDYLNQENRYEVAFLAIMITDKFLEHKRSFVKKQNYQLLGTTAFNLGVKFEAGFEMTCSECSNYCDKQFGEKEVGKHEIFSVVYKK
jgi:hypothetical protein